MEQYDVIVIGGGPGGYHAAHLAGSKGMKTLLVEQEALGGTCLNWGCIPTKTLLNVAKHKSYGEKLEKMGLATTSTYAHETALHWKNEVVKTLQRHVGAMLKKSKADVVTGVASIEKLSADEKRVVVKGETNAVYSAKQLIVASGVESYIPPIEGIQDVAVCTSRDMLELEKVPQKLAIVGGGVIGIEFASLFAQLGSKVAVFEALPSILPMMDGESAALLQQTLSAEQGIEFFCGAKVQRIEKQKLVFTNAEGAEASYAYDEVLVSVGRKRDMQPFATVGLQVSKTNIVVDERMMTNIPGVYAIGDVAGSLQLAHVAYRMAEVAVDAMNGGHSQMRYTAVPMVVYANPELASCGLSEAQASEQGYEPVAAALPVAVSGRALAEYGTGVKGTCKIVADAKSAMVLGVHMVGPTASEIISAAAVILEAGLRVRELSEIIFPHPTVGEIIHNVSMALLQKIKGIT